MQIYVLCMQGKLEVDGVMHYQYTLTICFFYKSIMEWSGS